MFTDELRYKAFEILNICRSKNLTLATAESCTGGLIAALFTEIPGSSDVFERGFITYSNASKTDMTGVEPMLIGQYGAVSHEVAEAMARGARRQAGVDVAIAVTGVAGPGGSTPEKPVGLVYIAVANGNDIMVERNYFAGSRSDIRLSSVAKALAMLKESLISPSFVYVV